MKKILVLIVIILSLGFNNTFSQIKPLNDKMLYDIEELQKGPAIFADQIAEDSLRVIYKVQIRFKKPLCERMKRVRAQSAEVQRIWATPLHDPSRKPYVFDLSKKDTVRSPVYQDFWYRYTRYIESWYENLSYDRLTRSSWYDGTMKMSFTGVFLLVPEPEVGPCAED